MSELSGDAIILGPCDAMMHVNYGMSPIGVRIQISIDSRFMILKNTNGELLARFRIVFATEGTLENFEGFYVDNSTNDATDTSFQNPFLCFRRLSVQDLRLKCLLKPINLWDDYIPEFVVEFDIGFERDLVSHTFLGLSHLKHYIKLQIKKDSMNNCSIVGSAAITDNLIAIVRVADRRYLPDYLWVICSQLKKGRLREYDINNISRKRNPLLVPGYLGLRCIHCGGLENGNYFPTKRGHLYGCAMRFEKHLHACRKCPSKLKQLVARLKQLHKSHEHGTAQKVKIHFFDQLWDRIQNPELDGDEFSKVQEILTDLESKYFYFSTANSIENHKVSLVRSPAMIEDLEETVKGTIVVRKSDDPIVVEEENLDPLSEYLNCANVGEISPSDVLQSFDVTIGSNTKFGTVLLNDETQFTWDRRSLTDLDKFLQSNPDMVDCLDVLLP